MYPVANTYVELGTKPYHEGQVKNDLNFTKTENGWNSPILQASDYSNTFWFGEPKVDKLGKHAVI
jgi:hypothetical protein